MSDEYDCDDVIVRYNIVSQNLEIVLSEVKFVQAEFVGIHLRLRSCSIVCRSVPFTAQWRRARHGSNTSL